MFWKFLLGFAVLTILASFSPSARPAQASQLIGRDGRNIILQADNKGFALVSYTVGTKRRNVLVRGAVNEGKFKVDYSGGWQSLKVSYWKSFRNACKPYDGPKLAWFVTACKAPDGSYWAIQSWQRGLPSFGKEANSIQGGQEIRISHWRGGLPTLEVNLDWSYKSFHHLYGRLVYQGRGVKGLGPNVYVDTYNSKYGSGWRRENGFVTHQPNGTFCYGFSPHGDFPSGEGERYRVTALGPGVTPDVLWEGASPGSYNRAVDLADLERQKQFLAGDNVCKPR